MCYCLFIRFKPVINSDCYRTTKNRLYLLIDEFGRKSPTRKQMDKKNEFKKKEVDATMLFAKFALLIKTSSAAMLVVDTF